MAKARTDRTTAEEIAELRQAIDRLTDAVGVLIDTVDRLTDEVQWRNNQLGDHSLPPFVLTSMPKDPTAPDWQINRVKPEDLPAEATTPDADPPPTDPVPPTPQEPPMPPAPALNLRDLSTLERSASWMDELIHACRKGGPLYTRNPNLVADVTRKAKALATCLTTLRQFLDQPPKEAPP